MLLPNALNTQFLPFFSVVFLKISRLDNKRMTIFQKRICDTKICVFVCLGVDADDKDKPITNSQAIQKKIESSTTKMVIFATGEEV